MYSSNVRLGNWMEDIALSEEKLKLYVTKRDREELLVQHMRKLFANVFREVRLARPADFITFGSSVQLQAPDMPGFRPRSKHQNYGVVLAGTINERDIDKAHHFLDGCCLVSSPDLIPCVRNTFIIKSADCRDRNGQNPKFGQEFLLQEKLKLYVTKRDREELLVQHMRKLFANVFREVRLARPADFITFGSSVQLQAPDMPGFRPRSKHQNYGVVLAGTINERDIDKAHHFLDGCCLVSSPDLIPCVRNTFLIKSADCHDRNGQNLKFGQEFLLQLIESGQEPLYVRAETPCVDAAHGPMEHNPVSLSNKPDCYSKWKVLYWDPNMRFETTGAPFPPSTRVLISHVMTGLCLAVEYSEWYLTIFGTDCGVSVHTYADVHRRETAECLWMFVTEKVSSENADCSDLN